MSIMIPNGETMGRAKPAKRGVNVVLTGPSAEKRASAPFSCYQPTHGSLGGEGGVQLLKIPLPQETTLRTECTAIEAAG